MALQTGTILDNRYRILGVLGQGGFGAVYRAADMILKRPCAVKENLDTSPEAQRQFEKEATILSRLSHPNMPGVQDHYVIPGQGQYIVMDFIEGEDLQILLERDGPVPPSKALDWIGQIAGALTYLHEQKPPIIHRDTKPANIRLTPDGRVFLVDFGLVKIYDPHLRTTVGARAVTPGYSPPEQYGQGSTDSRTDIYALGATLYSLLTGLVPQESVLRVVDDRLVPLYMANTQVQQSVGQIVEKAMNLQPSQRFQTVENFQMALMSPSTFRVRPTVQALAATSAATTPHQPAIHKQPWFWLLMIVGLIAIIYLLVRGIPDDTPATPVAAIAPQAEAVIDDFPTFTPLPTYTSFPTYTVPPVTKTPNPTNTPLLTDTPRPTRTPIPEDPEFRANENMFCRDGPGSSYEDHTMVLSGETVPVYAKSSNGWWLVGIDKSSTRTKCCWVGGNGSLNVNSSSIKTIDYLVDRITCQRK